VVTNSIDQWGVGGVEYQRKGALKSQIVVN
jgi:hypothetical protein